MRQQSIPPKHHPAVPEVTSPFEDSTVPRPVLLPKAPPSRGRFFPSQERRMQQPTLIIAYIHGDCYHGKLSHVLNNATTLFLVQTATENSRNHSYDQEHNPGRYEESQRANHAILKIRITRTAKNNSQGIYTLRIERRKGRTLKTNTTNLNLLLKRIQIIPYCARV